MRILLTRRTESFSWFSSLPLYHVKAILSGDRRHEGEAQKGLLDQGMEISLLLYLLSQSQVHMNSLLSECLNVTPCRSEGDLQPMSGAAPVMLTRHQRVGADAEPWTEVGSDLQAERQVRTQSLWVPGLLTPFRTG